MHNLSLPDLSARHDVLTNNITTLVAKEGKLLISPVPYQEDPKWIELYTHCLHELRLRRIPFPGPFNANGDGFLKNLDLETRRAVFLRLEITKGLFKLGKKHHLADLRTNGKLRLTPATVYGKGGYGYAVDDDEINKYIELNHGNSVIPSLLDGINLHEIARYNIRLPIKAPTDYYLFSMSNTFRYRHVFDFHYNGALQIDNRAAFISRVREGVKSHFGKDVEVHEINVTYVDPLRPINQKYVAMSMKHIKFAYQTEFRFCLVPRSPNLDLGDVVTIDIEPLEDISHIIDFEELAA
ncbi:hypothetical protein [Shinella sp. M31]|uniref:hypothetical protein n=1 Tax=Shinella sp. M31 TaxID=3368615 RepID=UPI003B9F164A